MNMKLLMSTVDPPLPAAGPLDADGVEVDDGVAPSLPEPELQADGAVRTASRAAMPRS
jgi:hypothetical protein